MVRDYILSAVRKNSAAQVLLVQYQGTTPTCARKLIRLFPCLGHAAFQRAFYSVPHALSAPGRDKCGRFPSAITGRHTGRFGQGTQRWQSNIIQDSNKAGTKQFPQSNGLLYQLLVVLVAASCGYTKERRTEEPFWVLGYQTFSGITRLFVPCERANSWTVRADSSRGDSNREYHFGTVQSAQRTRRISDGSFLFERGVVISLRGEGAS